MQEGTLKYTDDAGRVAKGIYNHFLERITHNINYMMANVGKLKAEESTGLMTDCELQSI